MPARKNATFAWTAEEWAVLEPLSEAERFKLALSAIFSGRGLIGEAQYQKALTRGGGVVDTPGY